MGGLTCRSETVTAHRQFSGEPSGLKGLKHKGWNSKQELTENLHRRFDRLMSWWTWTPLQGYHHSVADLQLPWATLDSSGRWSSWSKPLLRNKAEPCGLTCLPTAELTHPKLSRGVFSCAAVCSFRGIHKIQKAEAAAVSVSTSSRKRLNLKRRHTWEDRPVGERMKPPNRNTTSVRLQKTILSKQDC